MVGTLGFTSFTPVLATTATWTAALPAQPGAAMAAWAIGAGAAMAVGVLAALSTRLAEGRRRRSRAPRRFSRQLRVPAWAESRS